MSQPSTSEIYLKNSAARASNIRGNGYDLVANPIKYKSKTFAGYFLHLLDRQRESVPHRLVIPDFTVNLRKGNIKIIIVLYSSDVRR